MCQTWSGKPRRPVFSRRSSNNSVLLLLSCSSLETRTLHLNIIPPTAGKPPQKLKHKIKAQHVISPRTIPRPPSHHALRRLRDNKTTPENPTTPKDNITLKKISLKNTYSNHEDTFYTAFNSTQSAEPPKAEKAPSEIQLELPSDQMFSPVSRASTTLSITKICLNVSSACNKDSDKITMQSRKEKHQNTPRSRPITRDNRSRPVTRDTGTRLSVKTVKNAAVYVKKANRLKGVKLKPKAFKKNVKLVGIIKTPKRKHEKSVTDEKNGKNLVEANSLIPVAITEAVRNTNANTKNKPGTESDEMQANCIDIEDANFFMCSNETVGLPLAEKEHNRTIEVKLSSNVEQSIHTQEHRPQSPVTVKPMPAKHHKFVLPNVQKCF